MKMESIRKWFYKPKRDDPSLLAQFFYADEALNLVAAELDSFDGRKDPERCTALVNHLRQCQDKVLTICNRIMDDVIPTERANRDFRVKFPDDVMQENLAGQLWFGAECLAAGSSIMNRECESAAMRPLAKALTKALENVRNLLREQCLRGNTSTSSLKPNPLNGVNEVFTERLQEALKIFDRLFAEFELSYVSAMVPVKSIKEYELQQLVVVLFSETLQRALKMKLLTQEMVDDYDPALMFTIPRLAIVSGLLIFPDGPLCLDRTPADMSEMFRPFRTLLFKIRELLWTLNNKELFTLEKLLCSSEEPSDFKTSDAVEPQILEAAHSNSTPSYPTVPDIDLDEFITHFYIDHPSCKQFMTDFYANDSGRTNGDPPEENEETRNILHWEDICKMSTSTEDSEDETEWVGETSECETVVITDTCSNNGVEESVETDIKTTVLPDDVHPPMLGFREALVFGEHVIPENSSPLSEAVDSQIQSSLPLSENIEIPIPNNTGFLLANQVGQSILASVERTAFPRLPDLSPGAGESLPDGDSHEAMSAATATLSNLLYRTPSPASPANSPKIELEDDSGVGTVLNVSDISMSSGRSFDTRREPSGSTSSTSEAAYQHWQVETIPCNCFVSSKPTTSGESNKHQKSSHEESPKNINGTDLHCDSNIKQLEETDVSHRSKIKSVLQSENTNNVNIVHKVNSCQNTVSQDIKRMCQDVNRTDSSHNDIKRVSKHVLPVHSKTKSVPSITLNAENSGAQREEEWQGMAVGEGHCTVCSGSEDWQHLMSKPPPGHAQEVNRTTPISSLMGKKEAENGKEKVVTNMVEPAVRNSRPALAVVPSHSGASCSISSETSSFNSECQDDEEIALAMQAAEIASRNEARAKFRSSEDLVHRLFVCIAGVADQLQTNFAGDLRHILKSVFLMSASCSPEIQQVDGEEIAGHADLLAENDSMRPVESAEEALSAGWEAPASPVEVESPPPWIPDELAPRCMSCEAVFTVVRRRHHCRNCGKVFCARCSSNSVPLPRFGHVKPVRVCNRCFLYQVTPFTLEELATRS